jgi:hypothetical protein
MADSILVDPRGRRITLQDRTWFGHVLRRHPEMRNLRPLAEQTVRTPAEIRFSQSDPDCRKYYAPGPTTGILVVVIANVVAGFVMTAYLTNRATGTIE